VHALAMSLYIVSSGRSIGDLAGVLSARFSELLPTARSRLWRSERIESPADMPTEGRLDRHHVAAEVGIAGNDI